MRPGVGQAQAEKHTTRRSVPLRRHRALHAGQEDKSLRPRRHVGGRAADRVVLGVGAEEMIAPPAQVASRDEAGIFEQPAVGVAVRMTFDQHRAVLPRRRRHRAHGFRRAHDVANLAGREHARAQRGGHLVATSNDHGCVTRESGRGREGLGDGAHAERPGRELGQHAGLQAGGVENRVRPPARPGVEQRERRGVRVIHHRYAGRFLDHERPGRHEPSGAGEDVGLFVLDPERFEHGMRRIQVGAHLVVEVLARHTLRHGRGLRLGAPVHPDHRVAQWLSLRVADDHAVELRSEGDRLHGGPSLRHLVEHATQRRMKRVDPSPRVLLRPSGPRKEHVIGLVSRGHQPAVVGIQGGVGALAPDIAADHVRPGH